MAQIVLDAANLKKAMRHLAKVDPDFARAIKEVGHPELRIVPSGFGGLMRSIVGQQVSVHAARSIWLRLEALLPEMEPAGFLALSDEQLRELELRRKRQQVRRDEGRESRRQRVKTPPVNGKAAGASRNRTFRVDAERANTNGRVGWVAVNIGHGRKINIKAELAQPPGHDPGAGRYRAFPGRCQGHLAGRNPVLAVGWHPADPAAFLVNRNQERRQAVKNLIGHSHKKVDASSHFTLTSRSVYEDMISYFTRRHC